MSDVGANAKLIPLGLSAAVAKTSGLDADIAVLAILTHFGHSGVPH
jgi:hypothetical protein